MQKNSRHLEEPEEDFQPSPIPVDADGGPLAGYGTVGSPMVAPPWIAKNTVCLRGPCRHYWHLVTMAQEGNPAETWKELGISEPRKHSHVCLVQFGMETEFGDDNVYECSKWDPHTSSELVQIRSRREAYYRRHPDHLPTDLLSRPSWFRRLLRWFSGADAGRRGAPLPPRKLLTEDAEYDA